MRILATMALALALIGCASVARANGDEAAIGALIDRWYEQQRAGDDGRVYALYAPGAIDASPGYYHLDTGAANRAPRVYTSLAATALQFEHEIVRLDIDTRFARVGVWERGVRLPPLKATSATQPPHPFPGRRESGGPGTHEHQQSNFTHKRLCS
ncbi:MAG: hypothetical protein NVV62_05530 [Terricaulis sp.]|nr:hypothetical protein [Terricaulis sp.]